MLHRDSLLRGDLVAHAEREYPRGIFPTSWADIPDDLRLPLIWDGRLLTGRRVAELAKSKITDEIVLSEAGCARVFEEKASGGRWDRPELYRMLDQLLDGDP